MTLSKSSLESAAEEGLLEPHQVDPLYEYLRSVPADGPRFDFTHVLYYLGGLIAIGALTVFMNLGWEQFGGWGILFICLLYAGASLEITNRFRNAGRDIPAGICGAFVIVLTPLAVYGFQQGMGWWPENVEYRDYHRHIKFLWIYMELGTLFIGAVMLWRYRYPFLVMPIAATLWYMSMDIAELIAGDVFSYRERAVITMWFGLGMMLLALWVDIRSRRTLDYAFWLYLFGVMAFWGGMTSQDSDSELAKFLYFCINLSLITVGVILVRKVFVVFGALGACLYFGHLANEVFRDSWLFPVALTLIGAAVIYLGVLWQKNEAAITLSVRQYLPLQIRELLEGRSI